MKTERWTARWYTNECSWFHVLEHVLHRTGEFIDERSCALHALRRCIMLALIHSPWMQALLKRWFVPYIRRCSVPGFQNRSPQQDHSRSPLFPLGERSLPCTVRGGVVRLMVSLCQV